MSKEQYKYPDTYQESVTGDELKGAYDLARLLNHLQGFELIRAASNQHEWNVQFSELARIWTNGCIIRSVLMEDISEWIKVDDSLLNHESVRKTLTENFADLQQFQSVLAGSPISTPCFSASLEYMKGWISPFPTANMIQAQRDFFGAHTYERIDDPSGKKHHTHWED
jgi:6-phosphogluconate dehydrogenase